jgi:proteasome lid subunit RPN8/RPN11
MKIAEPVAKKFPPLSGRKSGQRVGTIPVGAVPVFVYPKALDQIIEFSQQDTRTERGGFLLGGFFKHEREFVEISAFLPAQETLNAAATLRFTHQTWARLHDDVEHLHPDLKIVGWHHTHPGFGVFLSQYDLFIHRHFFGQHWQVAMVVDPRKQQLGIFQWVADELVNTGFVCLP